MYLNTIDDDTPSINVVQCQDDESILNYLSAEDSYIHQWLPFETQTMLKELTIEINIHT